MDTGFELMEHSSHLKPTFSLLKYHFTSGSHGAGLWTGIYIAAKGHAVLDEVTIHNAKTAIKVEGQLSAYKITIEDAYIGVNVIGSARY